MAAASNMRNTFSLPTKPIKRVVVIGKEFICGMCRSDYRDYKAAQSCVSRCYVEWITALEPRHFKVKQKDLYQCPICMRHSEDNSQVVQCVEQCQKDAWRYFQLEAALTETDGPLPLPPVRTKKVHLEILKTDVLRHKYITEASILESGQKVKAVSANPQIDRLQNQNPLVKLPNFKKTKESYAPTVVVFDEEEL